MVDKRIKFRHIQCFVEIARRRSFKAAAQALHLTQPAVSKTMAELETIVGAPLLLRNRGGVSLTPGGQMFVQFAESSLSALARGIDGIARAQGTGAGRLSVGALPSVAAWLMPRVAQAFHELCPGAVLRIIDGPHGFLVDQLRRGQIDLVIGRMGSTESMAGLVFAPLYEEQVSLVVRPGHPLLAQPDLRRLPEYRVVYPTAESAIFPLVERLLLAHGIGPLTDRLETVSGAFGRVYVRMTDAVWLISSGVVDNEVAEGQLVRLPVDTALTRGPVGQMTAGGGPASAEQRAFDIALRRVLGG